MSVETHADVLFPLLRDLRLQFRSLGEFAVGLAPYATIIEVFLPNGVKDGAQIALNGGKCQALARISLVLT